MRSADRKEGGREEREGAMEAGGGQREERAWRAARGRSLGRAPPGAAAARDGGGAPRDGPPGTAPPGRKAQRRVPAAGDAREVFRLGKGLCVSPAAPALRGTERWAQGTGCGRCSARFVSVFASRL